MATNEKLTNSLEIKIIVLSIFFVLMLFLGMNFVTATTVTLGSDPYNLADGMLDWYVNGYGGPQIMWNISSVPSGAVIINATQCFYWVTDVNSGLLDNDINVSRVDNDTWVESTEFDSAIFAQPIIHSTLETLNATTAPNWGCVNASLQVKSAYDEGKQNVSLRFLDNGYPIPGDATGNWQDELAEWGLAIGSWTEQALKGEDREDTLGSGELPFLIVTYFLGPTFGSNTTNASTTTGEGGNVSWGVNLVDDNGLDFAWLTVNGTGEVFRNTTLVDLGDVVSVTLNETNITWNSEGGTVCGRFWFNDTYGLSNESENVCFVVSNTLPTIFKQPYNLTNASSGHWFTFLANATDVDGGADVIYISGNVSSGTIVQLENITDGDGRGVKYNVSGTALSVVWFNVSFGDDVGDIVSSQFSNVFPNQAPSVGAASINDTTPADTDDIKCEVSTIADADFDTTTNYFSWFKDGVDADVHNAILYAGNLTAGDVWKCYAWVGDGYEYSSNVTSSDVVVGSSNVAPAISYVNVTSAETNLTSNSLYPTRNDSWINVSVTFTDVNAGENWTMYACKAADGSDSGCGVGGTWCNSSLNVSFFPLSCSYNLSTTGVGSSSVYVYVVDNTTLVSALNSTSTSSFVVNHPPTVPSFSSSNNTWTTVNSTNLTFSASDSDGDTINYSVMWGTSLNPSTLAGNTTLLWFNKSVTVEDYYYATVYATDEHGYPSLANSTNLYLKFDWNRPNLTNVSVSSYSIHTTDDITIRLNCSDSMSNVDNSSINYTILKSNNAYASYFMVNASDNISDFSHIFTDILATAGWYYVVNVSCSDVAGNRNTSVVNVSFETTVYVAPGAGAGGGGGVVVTEPEIIEIEAAGVVICNFDGVCDVGFEDAFTCPSDCPIRSVREMVSLFLCFDRSLPCFWTTKGGWFPKLLFLATILSGVYLVGRPIVKKRKLFKGLNIGEKRRGKRIWKR